MNQSQVSDSEAAPAPLTRDHLLQKLYEAAGDEAEAALRLVELKAGDVLFEQGDEADGMYVLTAGALGVRLTQADGSELVIDKLGPGATVGEMALLGNQIRSATVYAINDAGLLHLTRSGFEQLSPAEQSTLVGMKTTVVNRWQRLQLAQVLRNLFGELDTNALHLLQSQLEWQHLSNGDLLFEQGAAADAMYLVVNGRLRFSATSATGEEEASGEIGPGETVGEFALLTDEVRSATVYAVRKTDVVEFTPPVFDRLVREYPKLMGRLTRSIVERQQRALQQVKPTAPSSLSLTIVPASTGVDAAQFAQALAVVMRDFGSALALDSQAFDEKFGRPGAAQTQEDDPTGAAIVSWLGEAEANHNYLLFAADHELSAWTERCIEHSDRVLILADPRDDPAPGAVEQMLAEREVPVRTELVLWHPAQTERPQGTAAWLDPRAVATHHHVRQGDQAHIARLARRLTGHAIALVLSGGAARGYAHMGVHRALEELDIPIDYIGATSMGAVIGAAMATHGSNEELVRKSAEYADSKMLFDRTLPLTAMNASKKVTRFTRALFGDLLIEDLWYPFFCIASNLTTAERVVYTRGPLWRAVRASLAIPGVFAPVMDDGDVIVDGGVMDNFPVKLTAALAESDHVIGVNVSPFRDKKRYYDFDTSISGWRVLFSRINPFSKSLRSPSLVGTIMRTLEINSVRRAKEEEALADLLIYPDVKTFSLTAYHRYADIAAAGYEAAFDALQAWREERLAPAAALRG